MTAVIEPPGMSVYDKPTSYPAIAPVRMVLTVNTPKTAPGQGGGYGGPGGEQIDRTVRAR